MAQGFKGMVTGAALLVTTLVVSGCDECWDGSCQPAGPCDSRAPMIPVGLQSETGDGAVKLTWIANQEPDLRGYRVYVNDQPDGQYHLIGDTRGTQFVDREARNGRTYFYAVTAYDDCDNESALSPETVYDTPRPAGGGLLLARASGDHPETAGYDFTDYRRQSPGARGTDIYFDVTNGVPYLLAADPSVGVQDIGYLPIADLDYAPAAGWARSGRVEVTEGHTYAVLTGDGYYAKVHVTSWDNRGVVLDWALQIDRGNRELSVDVPVGVAGVGGAPGAGGKDATQAASEGGVKS